MQPTLEIFRRLVRSLPPLVPSELRGRLKWSLLNLEHNPGTTTEQVEDTMIAFGYEVWPFRQAYQEFLSLYEARLGDHFLEPTLSPGLLARYHEFKLYGGSFKDLHSGSAAHFFESEERSELCVALVNVRRELRQYTDHQIVTIERQKFEKRVADFARVLDDITQRLGELNQLAKTEGEHHPALASQIRQQVRAFEFGLCSLGPDLNYNAVCEAPGYFRGRKSELQRLRGIHIPVELDILAITN
jgi:hypothetical protein